MEIKLVPKKDLNKVWKLHKEYVEENSTLKEIEDLYTKFPKLFVGCYSENHLIGICIPGSFNEEIYLKGIAIEKDYWRKGLGSKLLSFFEQQLRDLNIKEISVPSADISWVENFYLKNNYKPSQLLVKVKTNKLPKGYKNKGFKIFNERREKEYKVFYIRTNEYSARHRIKLKRIFNADVVIYILKKKL